MAQQELKFLATPKWVIDLAREDLKAHTAVSLVEVRRTGDTSGTLTLHADTREELKAAVAYLGKHLLYKNHFKPD